MMSGRVWVKCPVCHKTFNCRHGLLCHYRIVHRPSDTYSTADLGQTSSGTEPDNESSTPSDFNVPPLSKLTKQSCDNNREEFNRIADRAIRPKPTGKKQEEIENRFSDICISNSNMQSVERSVTQFSLSYTC